MFFKYTFAVNKNSGLYSAADPNIVSLLRQFSKSIKQINSFFCIFFSYFFHIFLIFFLNDLEFAEKYRSSGLKNVSDCTIRYKTQPRQKTIRTVRRELVRGLHQYCSGQGSNSESLNFFKLPSGHCSQCISCVFNCDVYWFFPFYSISSPRSSNIWNAYIHYFNDCKLWLCGRRRKLPSPRKHLSFQLQI